MHGKAAIILIGIRLPVCRAPALDYLRSWDFAAGQKPDLILANSNFIAGKIKIIIKKMQKSCIRRLIWKNFIIIRQSEKGFSGNREIDAL